jgi:putative peptidoglycan lipid II flippase
MAISTAVFPRLAEQAAREDEELRETLGRALRLILYLTIPASVGLMILAKPVTAFLLRSGAFDADSADLVVTALVFYSIGLFAHSGIEILSRGFYALSDTKTPVAFAIISMMVNLILSLALVWQFGIGGLAFALSAAAIVEFVLLVRTLNRRLHGLETAASMQSLARTVIATVLMAEVLALWLAALKLAGALDFSSKLDSGFAVAGGMFLGGATYYITSRLLRSPEATVLAERMPLPATVRRLVSG